MRKWAESLDTDNVTELLDRLLDSARPLVGFRSKSNIKWYQDYPILVVYTEVDFSSKSRQCSFSPHAMPVTSLLVFNG